MIHIIVSMHKTLYVIIYTVANELVDTVFEKCGR